MIHSILLVPLLGLGLFTVHNSEASRVTALGRVLNLHYLPMRELAGDKFRHNAPVVVPDRRQKMIKDVVDIASNEGLDPESAMPFVDALADVAEDIQQAYIDNWNMKEPDPDWKPKPTAETLKLLKRIDAIIFKLISNRLKNGGFKESDRAKIYKRLTAPYLTIAHRERLVNTMFGIKLKADQAQAQTGYFAFLG